MRSCLVVAVAVVVLCISTPGTSYDAHYDYDEVLHKSLLFYEAQRSGHLPDSQRVTWRADSATNDAIDAETNQQIDLEGGYYDGGDYVKFGYPLAAAVTTLAWGAVEYSEAYRAAGEMANMRAAVKWATDYFMKAHVDLHVFYGQVGIGALDHDYWGRPEDMNMKRLAFKITENNPGSDLAGETAAALAAASILFRNFDCEYSNKCLQHARQLYKFANNYRGKYTDSITDAANFYNSSGVYEDELAWAAAWLYRATDEQEYLIQAKIHYSQLIKSDVHAFSWDEKAPGVMVLLTQLTNAPERNNYVQDLKEYCDRIIKEKPRTPHGMVYLSDRGSLSCAANVAFVCFRAAELGIERETYTAFSKQQLYYILGVTGRSFVVGLGANPPQRPYHRSSSCKSPPATCTLSDFESLDPNPHILYGALVGGPAENGSYADVKSDFLKNEVTCNFNAGFQSLVAGLRQLAGCASVQQTCQSSGNCEANLIVKIPNDTLSWSITLTLSRDVTQFQADVANVSTNPSNNTITLTNKSNNGLQTTGNTLIIKLSASFSDEKPEVTTITFNNKVMQKCY